MGAHYGARAPVDKGVFDFVCEGMGKYAPNPPYNGPLKKPVIVKKLYYHLLYDAAYVGYFFFLGGGIRDVFWSRIRGHMNVMPLLPSLLLRKPFCDM